MDIKEILSQIYERLQTLDLPPTRSNMEKLLQSLADLQTVYKSIDGKEKKDGTNTEDRTENYSEGWNNV